MNQAIHFPKQFPLLTTERLVLKPFEVEDAKYFFEIRSNLDFMKFIGRPLMTDVKEAEDYIKRILDSFENQSGISWKICLKNQDKLLGYVNFWRLEYPNSRAEIGFGLHPDNQKNGYMMEVLPLVLNYGFQQMNFHSIMANTDVRNEASRNLLLKVGFQQEGHIREDYYFDGEFLDSIVYGLLEKDLVNKA